MHIFFGVGIEFKGEQRTQGVDHYRRGGTLCEINGQHADDRYIQRLPPAEIQGQRTAHGAHHHHHQQCGQAFLPAAGKKKAQIRGHTPQGANHPQRADNADVSLCAYFHFGTLAFLRRRKACLKTARASRRALGTTLFGCPCWRGVLRRPTRENIRPAAKDHPLTPPGLPGDVGARGKHKGSQCHQGGHDLSLFHEFQPPFSLGSCVIR